MFDMSFDENAKRRELLKKITLKVLETYLLCCGCIFRVVLHKISLIAKTEKGLVNVPTFEYQQLHDLKESLH